MTAVDEQSYIDEGWPLVSRLTRDMRQAASTMGSEEATWLVRTYYDLQELRKGSANRTRSVPNVGLQQWLADQFKRLEDQLKPALGLWAEQQPAGEWLKDVTGIGPVLSAGLLSTFKIYRTWKPDEEGNVPEPQLLTTVGHWWSFAGVDPTMVWNKGEKRPYNATAKLLVWKCSDSFVKFQNNPKCKYGHFYAYRKQWEVDKNESGGNEQAALHEIELIESGKKKVTHKETIATYKSGKLPDGRVDLRARRWTGKLFLSHLHAVSFKEVTGNDPPMPYAIQILGHVDYIGVGDCIPGCRRCAAAK